MEFYNDDAITTVVLVTLKTVVGLFGIWLGWNSLNWFWRGIVALAAVGAMIPPRAYDPALEMLVQIAVVASVMGIIQRWRRHREYGEKTFLRWRFQLADLFRFLFVFALALAIILYLLRKPRLCELPWLCFEAALQASVTLLATAIVFFDTKLLWRFGLIVLLTLFWLAVSLVEFRVTAGSDNWEAYASDPELLLPSFLVRNALLAVAQLVVLISVRFGRAGVPVDSTTGLIRVARGLSRCVLIGGGVGSAILTGFLWWRMTFLPTPPTLLLPDPNGFDRVSDVARLIEGAGQIDTETATTAELAAFVQANQTGIRGVRELSRLKWQRQLTFAEGADVVAFDDISQVRELFRALNLSVLLALREKRFDDAVDDSIAAFWFGARVRDNGLVIDHMIGTGFESVAITTLKRERSALDADQCRRLCKELQAIDREQLPLEQIEELDRIYDLHVSSYQSGFVDTITPSIQKRRRRGLGYSKAEEAQFRLLIMELAIRAFQFDRGELPVALDALTPQYLDRLPLDPFTEEPLIYRPQANGAFLIYSTGPDQDDDGGQSMSWQASYSTSRNGDFFLDCWDELSPDTKPPNAATDTSLSKD